MFSDASKPVCQPRFALVSHEVQQLPSPNMHYDLFLQKGGSLLSWRLLQPLHEHMITSTVIQTPAHRLKYLEFEGELDQERGKIAQIMQGHVLYQECSDSLIEAVLETARVKLNIRLSLLEAPEWELSVANWQPHTSG